MSFNRMCEKLAFSQFVNEAGVIKYSFDDVTDAATKRELELIQQAKLYKDFFAETQLIAMFRGLLNNSVNKSKAKQLLGYDLAYQHAVAALKASIRNFDLSRYKTNKPSSYFTTNIDLELSKIYKKETLNKTIRMSDDLNQHKNTIANAESILTPQLGKAPTDQQILNFIKNDLGFGSNLTLDKIKRIRHYSTTELSGSATLGKNNASGAESLTFEDVMSKTKSIDNILVADAKEQKIIDAIRKFTQDKNHRRFLMAYYGIGEFKSKGMKGDHNSAAAGTGLSYYAANKALDEFKTFCVRNGVLHG